MKRQTLISTAATIIGLSAIASCNPLGNYPNPDNFQGFIEQSFTRVSYAPGDNGLKSQWEEGDYVAIKNSSTGMFGDMENYPSLFMAMESDVVVNFICMDDMEPQAPYIGYYPPDIAYGELPNTQTYRPDGPEDAPMMAKSPTKYLMFRPICGAIEFKLSTALKDATVKSIRLRTEQCLCGGFFVDDSLKATVLGGNQLTLDCKSSGVALGGEPKSFWFSVPENSYTNLELTVIMTDGRKEVIKPDDSPVEVKQAAITTIPLVISSSENLPQK